MTASSSIQSLTDGQLYNLCKKYGMNARLWMRKFAGLLPEVFQRKLYKRRGYISIHEFASKLAGMSHENVNRILRLSEKLEDKPELKNLFETGTQGWSKIETVAYIATPETDRQWAKKVESLTQCGLTAYVQETRNNRSEVTVNGNLQPEKVNVAFPLKPETETELRIFKQTLKKEKGQALSWDEVMKELLGGYRNGQRDGEAEKKTVIQLCPECVSKKADETQKNGEVTRYIPAEVRKVLEVRSGGKCEFPKCKKAGEIYHHTRRYALKKNHDPNFIVFLCKKHERLVQAGFIENEEQSPLLWKLRKEPDQDDLKILVDERVAEFRREPVNQD